MGMLAKAQRSVDICVFTITDNRIRYLLADMAYHGVKIRIVTDNTQADATGSDAMWLSKIQGIEVRVDDDPMEAYHMHHKFCVMDGKMVMTGSFNWTRSAAHKNYENILITSQKDTVGQFQSLFKNMWKRDRTLIDIGIYKQRHPHPSSAATRNNFRQ